MIKQASNEIVLIDNYIDETTLTLLSHKNTNVKVTIYTKNISQKLTLATEKFNEQYGFLEVLEFTKSHDRFLLIDDVTYHIGASLKDIKNRVFGILENVSFS